MESNNIFGDSGDSPVSIVEDDLGLEFLNSEGDPGESNDTLDSEDETEEWHPSSPDASDDEDSPDSSTEGATASEPKKQRDPAEAKARRKAKKALQTKNPECKICYRKSTHIEARGSFMVTTPCGHIFCRTCARGFKRVSPSVNKSQCPVCRRQILNKLIHRVFF